MRRDLYCVQDRTMKVCSRCFDVVQTFNKMLASFRVEMELGIGGSKKKWRCLMKKFDSTKSKYTYLFRIIDLFINFLRMRCMEFTYNVS